MNQIIDIYIDVLIATTTIVAPLIIFFLGLYGEEAKKRVEQAKKKEQQVQEEFLEEIQKDETDVKKSIIKSTKKFEAIDKKVKNQLRLLNPWLQIKRIFIPLIFALILIVFDVAVREGVFNFYHHLLSILLIAISLIAFLISLYMIVFIVWTLINIIQPESNE